MVRSHPTFALELELCRQSLELYHCTLANPSFLSPIASAASIELEHHLFLSTPPLISRSSTNTPLQADKLRTLIHLESLQAKYVGTGHADTTRHEWTSNIQRDSLASFVGHPPLLSYMAIGMGEPREVVRARCVEKMVRPVGPPPETER